jgi:hypothetical protein
MNRSITLALATAAAIAGSAFLSTGAALAAPAPAHKPLICMVFPSMDVCAPAKPIVHHHHHARAMKMKKKP